jgi:U6 snRNA-associated Sm-like protein LSm6
MEIVCGFKCLMSPPTVRLAGILVCIDGYMNIAMEQTEEFVEGKLKNSYGDAFIRGNNVLYISSIKEAA